MDLFVIVRWGSLKLLQFVFSRVSDMVSNRRMKDKRQKLAITWPYDPLIYAYLVNAASAASLSQYSYTAAAQPLPPPPMPHYYASLGLQRVAAAYKPYMFSDLAPMFRTGQNFAALPSLMSHSAGNTTFSGTTLPSGKKSKSEVDDFVNGADLHGVSTPTGLKDSHKMAFSPAATYEQWFMPFISKLGVTSSAHQPDHVKSTTLFPSCEPDVSV